MFRKLLLPILVLFFATTSYSEDAVYLDSVVGLDPETGGVVADAELGFYFNFRVEDYNLSGFTNGFRVYSPDGATWQPITAENNPDIEPLYDLVWVGYKKLSITGSGADTIQIYGFELSAGGIPAGFDEFVVSIHTQVSNSDIGKTLCIDSSWLPPGNNWAWSPQGFPAWSGPHCFEIVDCCSGIRGDFNYDGGIDISDLTSFILWFHKGGDAAFCTEEGNVDGLYDGGLPSSISDLTYYVNYLFKGGDPPVACP